MSSDSEPSWTVPLERLRSHDAALVGGKAANLGEMAGAGLPVPRGFAITTLAFRQALRRDDGSYEMPDEVASAILTAYEQANLGLVSVRSSATAEDGEKTAWAGQLETYLQVDRKTLLDRVADCWASLYSPRASDYALRQGVSLDSVEVAVVVQEMVQAEAAGVGFSVHPVTQEPDLMMVQAARGLGEAVVSGEVRPDTWVVSKSGGRVVEWAPCDPSGCSVLTEEQAIAYGRLLGHLESHFGQPMDTEWAFEAGSFKLLQARPITTLAPDYQSSPYDLEHGFRPTNRRPWQLLSSSIFAKALREGGRLMEMEPLVPLQVEIAPGLVQVCFSPEDFARWPARLRETSLTRPQWLESVLREGLEWEARVDKWRTGGLPWSHLEGALADCLQAMLLATVVPFGVLGALSEDPGPAHHLLELAQQLRSSSVYPWFFNSALPPLVEQRLRTQGWTGSVDPMRITTVEELAAPAPDLALLDERERRVQAGELFVHQRWGERETVSLHPQTGYLLARLSGARLPRAKDSSGALHGSTAYPGVAEGVARVVTTDEVVEFQPGDVLVSINANPSLMGYMTLASAIVTDEGGASCHAAIVARELKKPCIVGTGEATTRIRSGQRIRVDGIDQTVVFLP